MVAIAQVVVLVVVSVNFIAFIGNDVVVAVSGSEGETRAGY